jgi:large subunit ribosomal protein L19e
MSLKNQKRIAASVLNCSPHRVRFDTSRLGDIKEAITKSDLRGLVAEGAIRKNPITGVSRGRARALADKKRRGQRRGPGSRKGTATARQSKKITWINKIRSQRKLIAWLIEKNYIDRSTYNLLYRRAAGGFFRNVRHIKLYLEERRIAKK